MDGINLDDFERFAENQLKTDGVIYEESNSRPAPGNTVNVDVSQFMNTINNLMRQNSQMLSLLQINQPQASSSDNIKNFNIMPDLSKTIDNFSAEGDLKNADTWIRSLKNTAKLHSWPDAFIFQTAQSHLEGAAKCWFNGRRNNIEDWATFEKAFRKTFILEDSRNDLWTRMNSRRQVINESISSYFHEKVSLCKSLNLAFSEIKEQVAIGLLSDELSTFVLSKKHADEDDLYQDIMSYERVHKARAKPERRFEKKPFDKPKVFQKKESTPRSSTQFTQKFRCYNCNEGGHVAASCPKPTREKGSCFSCGKMDHRYKDCPSSSKSSVHVIQPSHFNPYTLNIVIALPIEKNNISEFSLLALLDSGSCISVIKERYCNDYLPYIGNQNFTGINGSKLNILGTFEAETNISEDLIINLKYYVVPDDTMSFPVILGRDFMSLNSIKITFNQNCVSVTKADSEEVSSTVNEIMSICYENVTENHLENLNINEDLDNGNLAKFSDLFLNKYIKPKRPFKPKVDYEFKLHVIQDHVPFFYRPRRLSQFEKSEVLKITNELMEQGVIRKSNSEYSSPIVLVPKKNDSSLRMCIDYRQLNKITLRDNFPLPLIEDQLDQLKDKRYFTLLDLKSAFHHLTVEESSVKYTSFVTPMGQFEYIKMPFGLKNSPAAFMRYINLIFSNLLNKNKVLIYIDDILVPSLTIQENLDILSEVFDLLVENNLTLRLDKCYFLQSKITYLGYVINEAGMSPNDAHTDAIKNYPIPRNVHDVQKFVGLTSYFRKFIPNFSIIAAPLYNILKKHSDFKFDEKDLMSFNALKKKLSQQPVLCIYSPKVETELHCDASSLGYGSILMQRQRDGKLHPIFFFSKRTTEVESKYSSYELECLCIINSLKRFYIYLHGIKFKILTDCDSLRLTLSKKDVVPRIMRWVLYLENFDYTLEHRPGKRMMHVDALSRAHNIFMIEDNTFEQVLGIKQTSDFKIRELKKDLLKRELALYELRNGLVYRKENGKLLFFAPEEMVSNIIRTSHEGMGHLGTDKIYEYVKQTYWFPNMKEKIRLCIQNCLKCIMFNPKYGAKEGLLHNIDKGNKPFDTIHADHLGPLEKTKHYHRHILVVIDSFTKYVKLFPCKSTGSSETITHLKDYFRMYSKPNRLISDRGSCFTSCEFKRFLEESDIKHHLIATGVPRANGQVEVVNRIITPMIAKLCENINQWDKVLSDAEFALNNTVNSSTREVPSKLLFGITQIGKINDSLRNLILCNQENIRDLENIRNEASLNIVKQQDYSKKHYDKTHKEAKTYQVGDYVVIFNNDTTPNVNKKLTPKFKGPYQITAVLPNDRYIVEDIPDFQLTQHPFKGTIDANNMKCWSKSEH